MLNHLLLGQILTRPNGFWRDPGAHDMLRARPTAEDRRRDAKAAQAAIARRSAHDGR